MRASYEDNGKTVAYGVLWLRHRCQSLVAPQREELWTFAGLWACAGNVLIQEDYWWYLICVTDILFPHSGFDLLVLNLIAT